VTHAAGIYRIWRRRIALSAYRIRFFKTVPDHDGTPLKMCCRTIDIGFARRADRAVEAAKHHFERSEGIANWSLNADSVEIEALSVASVWEGDKTVAGSIGHWPTYLASRMRVMDRVVR
jgi:hypothetical protein